MVLMAIHTLNESPIYLDYEDHGYEPDFCHVSAKHAALQNGGLRIHGWAVWQYNKMALAEFHSVWERPDGVLVDVTPPKFGAKRILFIPDSRLSIVDHGSAQALYTDRCSRSEEPYWYRGAPTQEVEWGMPNNNAALVVYCEKLGLPDTSMT
tara:strand:- start:535 stop:990 length:456 start_codon:yes stop_codon:yes gene_type:complete